MVTDTRVGPYRILRLIKRGGQGRVYLGYDDRLRRRVAIKILSLPSDRNRRSELLQEARLVASIDSPRIVPVYDVIEGGEHLAMVMAYIPGCDLGDLLAARELSLASILAVATDVSAALAAARQQEILHGDLKPANVLISSDGRVRLTDFGIARIASEGRLEQLAAGSPSAMSPEQFRGEALDGRSDLFSLGCLLYRLITGQRPFCRGGRLVPELLLAEDPAPPVELAADGSEVPAELTRIVLCLLQKSPAARPPNTHELRSVLRKLSRELPLSASGHLMTQARDCFRPESADDIPVQVPADLGRQGRSHLADAQQGPYGWFAKTVVAAALVVLATVILWLAWREDEVAVRIDLLQLEVASDVNPPVEVSAQWLVELVSQVARQQLGSIRVLGAVGATPVTTVYADPQAAARAREADESIGITLRCVEEVCVVGMQREWEQGQSSSREQLVLFPDAPVAQWRDTIEAGARELYP